MSDERITVNGTDYVKASSVPSGKRALVVIDRGWIYAGDIEDRDGRIYLTRAVWVMRWTGGQGISGVIEDPETDTDIRPHADLDLPAVSEIFRVPVCEDWGL